MTQTITAKELKTKGLTSLGELEAALRESKKDIKEGKFVKESVEKHIQRITRG